MPAVKRKAIPKAVRQQVYDSLNGHCGYCGCEITYKEMQVDHIEAVYLHEAELNAGEAQQVNSIENYMPACRMCNFYKSTMSIESFRKQLETLPERLEAPYHCRAQKTAGGHAAGGRGKRAFQTGSNLNQAEEKRNSGQTGTDYGKPFP